MEELPCVKEGIGLVEKVNNEKVNNGSTRSVKQRQNYFFIQKLDAVPEETNGGSRTRTFQKTPQFVHRAEQEEGSRRRARVSREAHSVIRCEAI